MHQFSQQLTKECLLNTSHYARCLYRSSCFKNLKELMSIRSSRPKEAETYYYSLILKHNWHELHRRVKSFWIWHCHLFLSDLSRDLSPFSWGKIDLKWPKVFINAFHYYYFFFWSRLIALEYLSSLNILTVTISGFSDKNLTSP